MKLLSLSEQRKLLQAEYKHERDEFRRAMEVSGIERRVKRGDAWRPVFIGRAYYNSLDQYVVEISRAEDEAEWEHNFEYGRQVCFFQEDASGMLTYLPFSSTVCFAEATRMVVTLPSEAALSQLLSAERLGVALHFDETTYRLMFDALARTEQAEHGRLAYLRDLFHSPALQPEFSAPSAVSLRLPWLNESQEQAVRDVLRAKDVLIVHGPPGTGKTTTLVEAVCEVLRREPQVLVCAQSNTAVDWISAQISERGVSVLRIGNPTRVSDRMLADTYERRFEAHPDYPTLWQIRRTIRQLYATPRKSRAAQFHQKIARLRERADELELRIRTALFDSSRVVACTLAGAASPLLTGQHFHTLFIDEAAQALEAACWIALQRADRVIFAGDHQQLPPTVKSPAALHGGLNTTLMERLAHTKPTCVRLLTVQYRMREELMRFSSEAFYGDLLHAAPSVAARSWFDLVQRPIEWRNSEEGSEEFVAGSFGRINKAEAQQTLAALHELIEQVGATRLLEERTDFGIISPYRAQVQYLRTLIRHDAALKPFRRAITINTVDAFQGQERDVIIVSLVRDNEQGQIGFLRDLRRMNVAITRARHKLIILGAVATLTRHPFYRRLWEYAQSPATS